MCRQFPPRCCLQATLLHPIHYPSLLLRTHHHRLLLAARQSLQLRYPLLAKVVLKPRTQQRCLLAPLCPMLLDVIALKPHQLLVWYPRKRLLLLLPLSLAALRKARHLRHARRALISASLSDCVSFDIYFALLFLYLCSGCVS
jgi:hypothetical protein